MWRNTVVPGRTEIMCRNTVVPGRTEIMWRNTVVPGRTEIMWRNTVVPGRTEMTKSNRIACWIPKATNTLRIYITYFFCTATMAARRLIGVTVHVRNLSCYSNQHQNPP
jgi:hypothetical protein